MNYISQQEPNQMWIKKVLMLVLADILIVLISYFMALLLRFDFVFSSIPEEYLMGYLWSMPFWIISTIVIFYICRLYHSIWRLASVAELQMILIAYSILAVVYSLGMLFMQMHMPRSYYFIGFLLNFLMTTGLRFSYRLMRFWVNRRNTNADADLSGLPFRRLDHYLSEEELEAEFGVKGWKQLPDAISRKYHFVPAKVEVEEHHIGVYASKTDEHMVKVDHPKALLHGSLVSPSLGAAIINGKYVNAVPLYRLEQEFQRYGLQITRQNMANWCIRLAEEYLSILYDHLHKELYFYHVIQADETPVLVNHDGRKAGSKSWMLVYRSGQLYQQRQIVLYEYQQTRNASHPREFLKGYDGICVTDGYQVYHTLEKELEELTIAGCWVHCRRRFDEALKLIPKSYQKESNAFLLMKQIQAIYREEGKLNNLSSDERLKQRQAVIKPLVDAFFAYLKTINVSKKDKFGDAVGYARNQEKYLRVFLTDGDVPIDNNASERAIRGFCIGKKNWQMIDTIHGAKSSAIIYSIVETAKANNLKPFDYVQHLLEEIPKHMNDKDCSFLEDLLPWSEKLPAGIRKA